MKMMVHFTFKPEDAGALAALTPQERERVRELREAGAITALYLPADRTQGWLVMAGESEAEIETALASLPMHPYMRTTLTPLQ